MEQDQDPVFFAQPADFREWLEMHHRTEDVLWVGFYKKDSGIPSITWPESVDQALCYGWIDGLRKSVDDVSYKIRFTPRRKTSNWSAVNLNRMEELIPLGLVTEWGMKAYAKRKSEKSGIYSYETTPKQLSEEFKKRLKSNATAHAFFENLAPGYKKNTIYWVMSAKKEETRQKRFQILIDSCLEGKRIPILR